MLLSEPRQAQSLRAWLLSVSQPGHFVDFRTVPDLRVVAVFSGQMAITVSNGEFA